MNSSLAGLWHLACALVLVVGAASAARAQSPSASADEREVVAVVQRFFDAMAACDGKTAAELSLPEGRLYRVVVGGDPAVRGTTFQEFTDSLTRCGRKVLERMWEPQVRVHKGIATLWAPYDFWLNGAFSHCGIDSFELAKTPDGWKMTGGTYTIERDGCAPSPLGPPAP